MATDAPPVHTLPRAVTTALTPPATLPYGSKSPEATMHKDCTVIRWVLTHEPIALFEEAARHFRRHVEEASQGTLRVEILTPSDYGQQRHGHPHRATAAEVIQDVIAGRLQMSQSYASALGAVHDRLWALELPFLFEDHQHAAQVLDGAIGHELLDGLLPHGLRGLAFTYSGGYRIISSTGKGIHRLEDLAGLRVRCAQNPVAQALLQRLGATPVPAPLQAIPELTRDGQIDAAESTWPRYRDMGHHVLQPTVNDTAHSLFLTALVVNRDFFQRLSPAHQRILSAAALDTAAMERSRSVHDGELARKQHLSEGHPVAELTLAERRRLMALALPLHEEFAPRFGKALIDRIKATALAKAS